MKKITAIICFAAVLAVSGCDGSQSTGTTTGKTTEAPQTSATTSQTSAVVTTIPEPEVTTTTETEPIVPMVEKMEMVKDSTPLFYELSKIMTSPKSTVVLDTLGDDNKAAARTTIYIDEDIGLKVSMTDEDGTTEIMVKDGYYYFLSITHEYGYYYELSEYEEESVIDSIKRGTLGFNYDVDSLETSTGEGELNGVMYDTESFTDGKTSGTIYYDKETGMMTYMDISSGLIQFVEQTYDVDDSVFVVPDNLDMINYVEYLIYKGALEDEQQ